MLVNFDKTLKDPEVPSNGTKSVIEKIELIKAGQYAGRESLKPSKPSGQQNKAGKKKRPTHAGGRQKKRIFSKKEVKYLRRQHAKVAYPSYDQARI